MYALLHQTGGVEQPHRYGNHGAKRAHGHVIAGQLAGGIGHEAGGGEIHHNLNCRGRPAPEHEIQKPDTVGDAGSQGQAKADECAAEGKRAGQVAVFNQLQFVGRGDAQIHGGKQRSHAQAHGQVLQIRQILLQGNAHGLPLQSGWKEKPQRRRYAADYAIQMPVVHLALPFYL